MSMETLDEDSGAILRSRPSASMTILGGSTFHLQNPMEAYSPGRPRDSAYFLRYASQTSYSSGWILPVFLHSLDRHEGHR